MDTSFYRTPHTCRLAIHCLLKANHKDRKILFGGKEITVKRGQFITGRKKLSEEIGLSEQNVKTALKNLEKVGFLTKQSTKQYSIITVVNYNTYQTVNYAHNHESNHRLTSLQPTTNQALTTTNKSNNGINGSNENRYIVKIQEIIGYLNQKTGKNFRYETRSTNRNITARFKEGRTVEECKKVIDNRCKTWLKDTKMKQYLRPKTLFNPENFESYLNDEDQRKESEYEGIGEKV